MKQMIKTKEKPFYFLGNIEKENPFFMLLAASNKDQLDKISKADRFMKKIIKNSIYSNGIKESIKKRN